MLLQLQPLTLSARVKYLLEKVGKGKHRDQNDTLNEFRTKYEEVKLKIKKQLPLSPRSKRDGT